MYVHEVSTGRVNALKIQVECYVENAMSMSTYQVSSMFMGMPDATADHIKEDEEDVDKVEEEDENRRERERQ